jgi:probable HAF family extracellular repeat protein
MSVRKQLLKLLLLSLVASPVAALAEPTYSMTFLPQGIWDAAAIDNQGRIAVNFEGGSFISHAGLWSGGAVVDLGPGPGRNSVAFGMNSNGAVVGYAEAAVTFAQRAFVYSAGTMRDIGTLGGDFSVAIAINNAGQAVGQSRTADASSHAFLYENGTMTDLGTLGGQFSAARGINSAGLVVGLSALGGDVGETHAFRYCRCGMIDLGTLPGGSYSSAEEINDAGLIAGVSDGAGFEGFHAFLYANGVMTDIGSLGGSATVGGLNNLGQVVGFSSQPSEPFAHGFLYTGGQMVDLNTLIDPALGWTVTRAYDINDSQQIVAVVMDGNQQTRAVRLDLIAAIPEPGTYAMLLAGLALVSWRRRSQGAACRCA